MFYQCPYCDMKVSSRLKPCPYCGAASAHFKEVKEDKDFLDKVNGRLVDTRESKINHEPFEELKAQTSKEQWKQAPPGYDYTIPVRQSMLLIFAVLSIAIKGYGAFIALTILIVTAKKSSPLRNGPGRWARLIATGVLLVYLVLVTIALTLFVAYTH